ncbi:MAG: SH3 domain-containing protein [Proteobacteria bacterium]|nr:SH3 domain-containing protein [Pseudomonadota bacterium]MBU1059520.1 SH3 domain-containing protein [Pseudomonadota bacterium]
MNTTTRYSRIHKTISTTVSLFLLLPGLALGAQEVSVSTDGVNVRIGPGTDFPVYMELFQGYPLKVIEKKGDWLKISDFENDNGWIYASLVAPGTTVIVNAEKSINMRAKPSTSAPIIATVDRGVVLTKLSSQGQWTEVKHSQGTIGWIYSPLLWP